MAVFDDPVNAVPGAPGVVVPRGRPAVPEADAGARPLRRIAREHPLPILTASFGITCLAVWGARRRARGPRALAARLRVGAHRARRGAGDLFADRPLAVGVAAAALGLAAAAALPATRHDDELLGPARDRLLARGRAAGRTALHRGRYQLLRLVARVRHSVVEQGLTPGQLTGKLHRVLHAAVSVLLTAEHDLWHDLAAPAPPRRGAAPHPGAAPAAGPGAHPGTLGSAGATPPGGNGAMPTV